jgi:RNA polymerase sigma factor (sigma-70 family)
MMNADPLDALLDKLCSGDDAAAEQVFRAYEPYLRIVVRRMLPMPMRAKFDSIDVVQSVWADVLRGFRDGGWRFNSTAQLRAFLVKVTRNRFIDRARQNRTAVEHQQSFEACGGDELMPADTDAPSDVAEADELWERMLTLCPPQHRELLRLKRQGCSLAEIAEQTGLHESSVRRILYDLARRLAAQQ